jgi:hypothetical protein
MAPGAAGMETIRFLHQNFHDARRRGADLENEFRLECEEVARLAGLEFVVNVTLNQDRDIIGVFAGDIILANRKGAAFASDMYTVQMASDVDIIIADAYPFDGDLQFAYNRGVWPLETGSDEITKIILAACPNGMGTHELFPLRESFRSRLWRKLGSFQLRDLKKIPRRIASSIKMVRTRDKDVNTILVSNSLPLEDFQSIYPAGKLFRDWGATKTELLFRFAGRRPHIAIYQSAPLLIPKSDD